ncbi:MAG: cytochrome c biogenesis protein CcdA, partial [Hyphomicrobiales bacterium]|nr:cytochrome c biogenesis protein CcdA [Hyphomicrobiales bacterium]
GWTPCIGPILATILVIAASQTSLTQGVGLLAAYSLGLGVPFLLAAILLPGFLNASKKIRAYFLVLRIGAGALLAATGVAIFTGGLERFAWWSLELFPWLGNLG